MVYTLDNKKFYLTEDVYHNSYLSINDFYDYIQNNKNFEVKWTFTNDKKDKIYIYHDPYSYIEMRYFIYNKGEYITYSKILPKKDIIKKIGKELRLNKIKKIKLCT